MKLLRTLYVIFALIICNIGAAQTKEDATRWLHELDQPYSDSFFVTEVIWKEWEKPEPAYVERAMQLLEKEAGPNPGKSLAIKTELLKGYTAFRTAKPFNGLAYEQWYQLALKKASELGDEHLIQACCYVIGMHNVLIRNYETGLFHLLKAIELAEKLGLANNRINDAKAMATSSLYITHNYEAGIDFCKEILRDNNELEGLNLVGTHNNLALCYKATGKYDSALVSFANAASAAQQLKSGVWVGIAKGNMGDVLHLQHKTEQAVALWQLDVDSCLKYGEVENAGLSLAYISEYLFNKGERARALDMFRRAQQLAAFRVTDKLVMYRINANFLHQLGQYDSAYYFLDNYHKLNDSLNTVIARTNYGQLKLRLDFENNANQFKLIRKEKEAETVRRNFLLAALAIALLAGWLLLTRQRLKYKLAVQSAKDQLQLFTHTLLEKNQQIEQLNTQLHHIRQQSDDELIHQTILTDEDWIRFRQLFEKAHPGFFERLKKAAPDVTTAEARLAALLKLNLDNKQMASMQGISVSSLRGNKTRLRHRMNIAEAGLENFIANL